MPTDATLVSDTGLTLTFAGSTLRSIGVSDSAKLDAALRVATTAYLWGDKAPAAPAGELRGSELAVEDGRCVVTQVYDHVRCVWAFVVRGDDVSIEIALTHLGRSPHSFRLPTFSGLAANFAAPPSGNFNSWHDSYFAGHAVMHPSTFTPIGAAYLAGDGWGLAVHTKRHFDRRKLFHVHHVKDLPPLPTRCDLEYFVEDTIYPGETHCYDVQLRLAKTTDWKTLLDGYRQTYRASMPALQYEPDHRPAAFHGNADGSFVRPDNPLGFNDNRAAFRRFDRAAGVQDWVNRVAVPLAAAGGQGIIHWALMGHPPRGAWYRPDFDVFPPEVMANIPALTAGITALGLRAGLCARPGEGVSPISYTQDGTFRLSADAPDQMAMLLQRFRNATNLNFGLFYLDTFGSTLDDYRIMKLIRQQLGPGVQCFCEYHSDLVLPYAGRYTEWNGPGQFPFASPELFAISRYLVPETPILCKFPDGLHYGKLAEARLTPLVEDFRVQGAFRALEAFGKMFLDGKNWKA